MNLAEIPVPALLAVAPFRAEKDVRYFLDGIYAEPEPSGGAILVSTNGHIMAVIRSHEACVEKPCILKWSKAMDAAAKRGLRRYPDTRLVVETELSNAKVMDPGECYIEPGRATIDGRYPDWRKVIPENLAPGLPGCYQSKYLDKLLSIRFPHAIMPTEGINFFHDTKSKELDKAVVVARYGGMPDLIVVLMPMHNRTNLPPLPAWLAKPVAAEKAA